MVEIERERGRRSLAYFQRHAWSVVEPRTTHVPNWHIDAITDHLEAVTRGEIRNLLINIPPRCEKSLNVAVFWPAWVWTHRPSTRWLFASYAQGLSTRDSVKCRRVIQSRWYRERWGDGFRLTSDQNLKTRFENDQTGYRLATSVDGTGTGEGGDIVVVDDPHNVKEGESETRREGVLVWWDEVMSTRLNNPDSAGRVIVMQRIHSRDLSGHVLEQGGYEHLCLPMEYEPTMMVTSLGFQDPRSEDGELLWPDRFNRAAVEDLRKRLGPYAYAGQMQQRPTPREGTLFSRAWFEIVPESPRTALRGRYWDKAGKKDAGKYTAGVRMAYADGIAYIEDVRRGRWPAPEREREIKAMAQADAATYGPLDVVIWVEQEPGSGGLESVENTIRNLAGYRVEADRPTGEKFVRAEPLADAAKMGNVKLVCGPWNEEFLREIDVAGPTAAFVDQMDAAAGAFNKLTLGGYVIQSEEEVYEYETHGGFVA